MDVIGDHHAALDGVEAVQVVPEAEGSEALFIDEGLLGCDVGDFGDPRDAGEGGDADFVLDDLPDVGGLVGARKDVEV